MFPNSVFMPGDPEGTTMDAAVDYAKSAEVSDFLQHYLKKVILEKPDDPIAFLLEQIESDPWVAPKPEEKKE
jgi:hypothetical protein